MTLLKYNFPNTSVGDTIQLKLNAQNYTRTVGQNVIEHFSTKIAICNRTKMNDAKSIQCV